MSQPTKEIEEKAVDFGYSNLYAYKTPQEVGLEIEFAKKTRDFKHLEICLQYLQNMYSVELAKISLMVRK